MSREFRLFPSGAPTVAGDKFLFSRVDPASPTGFSNYTATLAQLAFALGISFFVELLIGDGVNVIVPGAKPTAVIVFPRSAILASWTLLSADSGPTAGSIVIDLWKTTYANYPPTLANTITAAAKPSLSNAIKSTSSVLTGWTTSFTTGDILIPNVDSVTGLKAAKLLLAYSLP
jgi:hypothetical protein